MMMRISGMVGMSGLSGKTKMLTDTKCYTFSDPQAQADLNDYRYFRNGGNVGNLRNVGNVRNVENFRNVRSDRQTPSIIHFWNNMLDLSYMMKSISGLVGMWGMSGIYKKFSVFFTKYTELFAKHPDFLPKMPYFLPNLTGHLPN